MSTPSLTKCKVVLLGDQSVGKTSIINRFIFDNFFEIYKPTVGIDFAFKNLSYKSKTVKMDLWDTAGQERYHSLIPSYIKDCSAAAIVFDLTSFIFIITDESSYNNLVKWINLIRQIRGDETLIFIMGNKSDLKSDAQQKLSEAAKVKFSQLGIIYMQVSAKSGHNIKQFFDELVSAFCEIGNQKETKLGQQTQQTPPKKKKSNVPENTNAKSVNLSPSTFKQIKENKKKKKCC